MCAGVFHAGFDVVHSSAAAQSGRSAGVDFVVADAEVACGVVNREFLEVSLEVGHGAGAWSGSEPFLQGLVQALT